MEILLLDAAKTDGQKAQLTQNLIKMFRVCSLIFLMRFSVPVLSFKQLVRPAVFQQWKADRFRFSV
jgi:hypothetical protein